MSTSPIDGLQHEWVDLQWGKEDEADYGRGPRGFVPENSSLANVVTSLHENSTWATEGRHALLLDLDIPATLVPSSTEGHNHLYIDVPDGIPEDKWLVLIRALADAGVIEEGYAQASIERGYTALRLPGVTK